VQAPAAPPHATQLASSAAAAEQHAAMQCAGLAHHALALHVEPGLSFAWHASAASR
jgi:hypothetical protein